MLLSGEKCDAVFKKVLHVKEHKDLYCIQGDRVPVSIEDLKSVIENMYGLKIEMLEVEFQGEFVRGMVERYKDGRARILIRSGQTVVSRRFTAAKELAHLLIDEEEDWSPHGDVTINKMLAEFLPSSNGGSEKLADQKVQSEMLAEIAATEILYPYEFRDRDAAELKAQKTSLGKLGLHYQIPEYIVGYVHSPMYTATANEIWARVLKKIKT